MKRLALVLLAIITAIALYFAYVDVTERLAVARAIEKAKEAQIELQAQAKRQAEEACMMAQIWAEIWLTAEKPVRTIEERRRGSEYALRKGCDAEAKLSDYPALREILGTLKKVLREKRGKKN